MVFTAVHNNADISNNIFLSPVTQGQITESIFLSTRGNGIFGIL